MFNFYLSILFTHILTRVFIYLIFFLFSKAVNPNGPELPETLKVRGEDQMARTYMPPYLAGP